MIGQRWREVFLLTSSLLDNADDFVVEMGMAVDGLVGDGWLTKTLLWSHDKTQVLDRQDAGRPSALRLAYISRALAHDRGLALLPGIGVDYALYYAWAIADILALLSHMPQERTAFVGEFPRLVNLCQDMGAADVAASLSRLPLPRRESDDLKWRALADGLWKIMEEERGFLPPRVLSGDDYEQVNDYFYAIELLVRCLELAYVTNRQEILDNLLRPPGALTTPSRRREGRLNGGLPPPLPAAVLVRQCRCACWERWGVGCDWCHCYQSFIGYQRRNHNRHSPLSRPKHHTPPAIAAAGRGVGVRARQMQSPAPSPPPSE